MIRALRRRHRWLAPLSFGCAGGMLALGFVFRPPAAASTRHGDDHGAAFAVPSNAPVARDPAARLSVSRKSTANVDGSVQLVLVPEHDLAAPDLLAYAAESTVRDESGLGSTAVGNTTPDGTLPEDARLLGPVAPVRATELAVPPGTATLIVYSLGHRARVATVDIRTLTTHATPPPAGPEEH
jgi:hypothetical protein